MRLFIRVVAGNDLSENSVPNASSEEKDRTLIKIAIIRSFSFSRPEKKTETEATNSASRQTFGTCLSPRFGGVDVTLRRSEGAGTKPSRLGAEARYGVSYGGVASSGEETFDEDRTEPTWNQADRKPYIFIITQTL